MRNCHYFWPSKMVSHINTVVILLCTLSLLLCTQWLKAFAIEVNSESGRKFLTNGMKGDAAFSTTHSHDTGHNGHLSFSSKIVAMAMPGVLIVGCLFLCAQSKKSKSHSAINQKEFPSIDSSSSFEVNYNLEKVAVSSWGHAPPSPSTSRYPPPSPSNSRHPPPSPSNSRHPPPSPSRFGMSPKIDRFGSVHLNFREIAKATHSFSSSCKIGEGAFGTVYKAQLPAGQWIAVKRAKREQFDSEEFNREIEILSKIEHRSLVRLLGYVDKGNERLIVTEYVSNGTLREHLDGLKDRILDFNQRLEIAIDVAHGLTYLHLYAEKQIIHRDVKSSNILLTENFKAKVADFGFARAGPGDTEKTHILTRVKGTVGYLDPEYMKTYQLTPKSDVYSFGVMLLEILTGRRPVEPKRPIEERVTLRWAFYGYNEGDVLKLVDPLLNESIDVGILNKMFSLAIQCAAPVRKERPDMKTVGELLWTIRMEYKGSRKGQSF